MREKIIQITALLLALSIGIIGTLYFTNDKKQTITHRKNVTINEKDSINESIKKVYNAVVEVENYQGNTLSSIGSGFVYKTDNKYGYIMTNYHVVGNSQNIKIINMSGETVEAKYLGGDNYTDIAVIRIDKDKVLDVAEIGDSSKSKLGDTIFTVGTPVDNEYMGSVTKGIISGEKRTITVSNSTNENYVMEAIQIDASINPGNSGGPLVNINGEVIGITSMKLVTSEIEGMGFAIPIEVAIASVNKLEKGQKIERPYIGVSLYDISNGLGLNRFSDQIDPSIQEGIIIVQIEKNSPADKAGLQANDVITKIEDTKIKSTAQFKYLLYKHKVGDTIKITVNRKGTEKIIKVKLSQGQ